MKQLNSREIAMICAMIFMVCVIASLLLDLRQSRNNERELSRRLYQAVRMGNTTVTNAN